MTENDHILLAYDGSDGAKAAVEAAGRLFPGRGADVVSVWRSVAAAAPVGKIAVPTEVISTAYLELDREAEASAEGLAEEGAAAARDGGLQASARGPMRWEHLGDIGPPRERLSASRDSSRIPRTLRHQVRAPRQCVDRRHSPLGGPGGCCAITGNDRGSGYVERRAAVPGWLR